MFKQPIRNQQGLTLIEMMVSLVLMVLVGIVMVHLVDAMQKNYAKTRAFNQVINEGSIGTSRIAADIRSAIKPNSNTKAVRVSAVQMDIYTFTAPGPYRQIRYELVLPTGESTYQLRRTEYTANTQPVGADPMYSSLQSSNIVLRGIVYNASTSPPVFEDKDPLKNDDRREVGITLTLRDRFNTTPMIPDQTINQIFVTRSQKLSSP